MRKWLILAGIIAVFWLMAIATYMLVLNGRAETQIQLLERENVKLRVVAENRELLWKISVIEEKLKKAKPEQNSANQNPANIRAVPKKD